MGTGYKELAAHLRAEIARGTYAPGATLPRQADLAAEFGMNIKTVRAAIDALASEGIVTPTRRRGTVVRQHPERRVVDTNRYAMKSDERGGDGVHAAVRVLSVELVEAGPRVLQALQMDASSPLVYRRNGIALEGGEPTQVVESYCRAADVEGDLSASGQSERMPIRAELRACNIAETVSARMPSPGERDRLAMPTGEPVVLIASTIYAEGGRPIEHTDAVCRASFYAWRYTVPVAA